MKTKFRFEVEQGINNCLLISDKHNTDLTSLTKHALHFLEQQSSSEDKPRTLIVSDIYGNELVTEMFYANIIQAVKSQTIDKLIVIGKELCAHQSIFPIQSIMGFLSTEDFLRSKQIAEFNNEVLLLKIAPRFHPNRILNHLQELAHDTVLEINFDAMFHNIDYFRSKINHQTKLMAMVKASAYGSGSVEVAQALQHHGVDYLAVAFTNEGVELRKAGINMPILVLDVMKPAIHQLILHRLDAEISNFELLDMMIKEIELHQLHDYPIHLKMDTGMHRAGFEFHDIPLLITKLKNQNRVKVISVFTHLAAADDLNPSMQKFTVCQLDTFKSMTDSLKQELSESFICHALNTAGIECYADEYQMDMVRLGIGLWGVNCRNQSKLRPVCSLHTRIMQVKTVEAGETIGYGRQGKVEERMEVALLPLGYADGIDRRLGNGVGSFYYKNQAVYIVGNICMDLLMIDVTGLDARVGDEVVIFDDNKNIADMANVLGTISYEVLTSISPRVRRVYYRD